MIKRIKVLSEFVVNQIAAGEVIERPASILKELLENSIDANSSMIRIYLENGGISSIKVVDNGDGIHDDDLPLAFIQHATSKITTASDLSNVISLGFRGEALASIASIAKTSVISQQKSPHGTTIEVKDVFYNIPARRKFLRSSKTEFNYTQELFKRIALSDFFVGFMLYHNNKLIKNLPAAISDDVMQKEKRIIKLFGNKFIENSTFFSSLHSGMELSGWVATSCDISGCQIQYFYINNRMVKDKLLNSAVKQATQKLFLPQAYCLYINLDPMFVDVNVHPTKQEVRFSDPKVVYAFVYESVLEALGSLKHRAVTQLPAKEVNLYNNDIKYNNLNYSNNHGFSDEHNDNNIILPNSEEIVASSLHNLKLASCSNVNANANGKSTKNSFDVKLFPIFNNQYLIAERTISDVTQLMFLDVLVGLKWLIEKKLQQHKNLFSYQLIIPERVNIDCGNINNVESYIKLLEKFKFAADQIHENVLLIRSIPDCLNLFNVNINYKNFLNELLQFKGVTIDKLINSLNNKEFINLILSNVSAKQLDLYTKNDLTLLIAELIEEDFCFSVFGEQEFSKLV